MTSIDIHTGLTIMKVEERIDNSTNATIGKTT